MSLTSLGTEKLCWGPIDSTEYMCWYPLQEVHVHSRHRERNGTRGGTNVPYIFKQSLGRHQIWFTLIYSHLYRQKTCRQWTIYLHLHLFILHMLQSSGLQGGAWYDLYCITIKRKSTCITPYNITYTVVPAFQDKPFRQKNLVLN